MEIPRRTRGGSGTVLLVVFSVILLAGMAAVGYFYFFKKPQPSVAIQITKPDEVLVGAPFSVTVAYSNESAQILKNAQISLAVPEDIVFVGGNAERIREEAVGDIGPGSLNQRTFTLLVTKGERTIRPLIARLRYGIEGSTRAQFEGQTKADVSVGQAAIALRFTTPQTVFSGERFETKIEYQNNSRQEFRNLRIIAEYPPNFQVEETVPFPSQSNNEWDIQSLRPGEQGAIMISGSGIGEEGSFFAVRTKMMGELSGQEYQLNAQEASIGVSLAPLSLRILVNGDTGFIGKIGDVLRYTLIYRNNSDVPLQDLTAEASLVGELFDFKTLHTRGAFNSINNTLSWAVANVSDLRMLQPGEERSISFDVGLKKDFSIKRLSDKNYVLKARASIQSFTVPPGVQAQKTIAVAAKETKVQGRLDLRSAGYFYDAPSDILNKGPYPPKVNQPTQYSIHWKLTNYATDVKNIRVAAFLQSGAKFTGTVKSNVDTFPLYNPTTGEVTWELPTLSSGRGILNPAPEVIFQIEAIPPITAVNQDLPLLSETTFHAEDVFTGVTLQGAAQAVTTALPDDSRITTSNRQVRI